MEITYGDATLVVTFSDSYDDSESTGSGWFTINLKQYADLYAECTFEQYGAEVPEWDEEENEEDEEVTVPNADDFIVFAHTAGVVGGRFEIEYGGAPYWLFHDLSHAEHDAPGGAVDLDNSGHAEDRALYDGAVMAHEHGVSLSEIFRELAKSQTSGWTFEERFGWQTDVIERFAEYLENKLTTAEASV